MNTKRESRKLSVPTHHVEATRAYKDRFIAFVDVLGFGSLIEASGLDPTRQARIIARIANAFTWAQERLDDTSGLHDLRFTHFSDSFVLSASANSRYSLTLFLLNLSDVIDCCLSSRLLVRGGITYGSLVHDDQLLFGPAMNRAYYLESKIAKFPRVILDPDLIDERRRDSLDLLLEDKDGHLYIDYLSHRSLFWGEPVRLVKLLDALKTMGKDKTISEKRMWLKERLDPVIRRFLATDFSERLEWRYSVNDDQPLARVDYTRARRCVRILQRFANHVDANPTLERECSNAQPSI